MSVPALPDDRMRAVFAAGGETGRLMRTVDWEASPLGAPTGWPQSLRSAVSICLLSRFPIVLFLGPELCLVYNDGYIPMLGEKAAWAMGAPGRVVWREIWPVVGPMLEGVVASGNATWSDDHLLLLERHGFSEECYFTFSYSPIIDENGEVGGVFCAVNETTMRVIGERRLRTLGELAERTTSTKCAEEACVRAAEALATDSADVPFSMIYLADGDCTPECVASSGDVEKLDGMRWPLDEVIQSRVPKKVELGEASALVLPIPQAGPALGEAVLVAGTSPRRPLDADYQRFFELVARQVGTAIDEARAYDAERKRAEALAELDRAKIVFFSNVSHEFRTPLTLLLGPLEQALLRLPPEERGDVEIAHRNGLRLLKLVNTLLDFSRIEAGRVQASYEQVDLSGWTAELASAFRSAIEAGGVRLVVDCPPLGEDAFIDREMWEKIVLNLVSNAFKFTFAGEIRVRTQLRADAFELTVTDTGVGVSADELPRLFDRFYRVQGARSRSHEGTGIGLSLVHDLVRLHGGDIRVESEPERGTEFTVTIPRGSKHLPLDQVRTPRDLPSTAVGAAPYVEEARRWLPDGGRTEDEPERYAETVGVGEVSAGRTSGARVLVVDDNADMRDYVVGLLSRHWQVESAADGRAAYQRALENVPDLVLADVMMPVMDGFELLRALRANESTRTVPVVMLSARAGEEATIEGLEAGADDYLVKPFSARELLARVRANLEMASMRVLTKATIERFDDAGRSLQRATASLTAIAQHIRAGVDLPELLGGLSKTVADLVGARQAVFWSLDGDELRAENGSPPLAPEVLEKLRVRVDRRGDRLADRILFRGEVSRWTLDGTAELAPYRGLAEALAASSGMSVPWCAGNEPLGVLSVYDSTKPGGFSEDDEWVLRIAALAAALVLEHKRLEDSLAAVNAREAGRLRAALDRSAELEKTKSEFLRLASHELRAPLTVLSGYVSLIKNGILGEVPADLGAIVPVLDRKVQEMRVLVDHMLETARLEDNRLALRRQRVDLRDVVASAIETMGPLVPASHELSVSLADAAMPVDGDPDRLATVLTNLIDNAIRYSPAGGRIQVRAAIRRSSRRVYVQIRDEGLGIAPHDLPRLFTRFGRIVTRENSHIPGTGLGLYLSNELVRMHGGKITVRSVPQEGSSFTVQLPLANAVIVPLPDPRRRASDGLEEASEEPQPIN